MTRTLSKYGEKTFGNKGTMGQSRGSGGISSGRKYSGLVLAVGRVLNEKAPLRICGH